MNELISLERIEKELQDLSKILCDLNELRSKLSETRMIVTKIIQSKKPKVNKLEEWKIKNKDSQDRIFYSNF